MSSPRDDWQQLGLPLPGPDLGGPQAFSSVARTAAAVPVAVWEALLTDVETRLRYRARVYQRGPDECWYWLGAISSTGHGKFRASSAARGLSRVVTAHVYGYQLAYGALHARPGEDPVISHRCDEASCQNPRHWRLGTRAENSIEYAERRRRLGGPLADVRGAHGRAVAVRDAILAARRSGSDIEEAIAAALAAGIAEAPGLF
ncbi:hypothetical protein [Thermostaphylospora chromogena]|uniref:HNH endonuclease n=1 Tax=Thermostaphylospora chromogena TaxID=35622 RepID=A0A1H0XK36_9ACTN|nr:hypothetical protein [Thermostaphylospora chromogena]SDQ03189.1 hypothetical protein SAMN04489764_0018 [Thermostaphylospora chromogena]SDQ03323.1 hypothetical protein SAMN04489764_0041 [Thermostaphylospora chromogena]SDQ03463.1 hypothetical protein SAMN04489764_0067 [Thermostaphylospora chromogena]